MTLLEFTLEYTKNGKIILSNFEEIYKENGLRDEDKITRNVWEHSLLSFIVGWEQHERFMLKKDILL